MNPTSEAFLKKKKTHNLYLTRVLKFARVTHVAIFSLEINTRTDRAAKITKGNETSDDEDCDRNSNREPGKVEGVGMKSFSPVPVPVFLAEISLGNGNVRDPVAISPAIYGK
ncbi:hypothetical protein CEXT_148061 [Caerostris extrusa]|uniref:Uncharacterized protein n=1 Tax=Caerostris extrusa TaxID=172846 RepID=A0AAV4S861_CAEEX|nr:hypothetical protein CEXT_148061 [Caerostris extrusa]